MRYKISGQKNWIKWVVVAAIAGVSIWAYITYLA